MLIVYVIKKFDSHGFLLPAALRCTATQSMSKICQDHASRCWWLLLAAFMG